MAIDRSRLSQPTRLALLEGDVGRLDRDSFGDNGLEMRVDKVESRLDIMGAKLGVYAALGALVGSGIVTAIVAVFLHH